MIYYSKIWDEGEICHFLQKSRVVIKWEMGEKQQKITYATGGCSGRSIGLRVEDYLHAHMQWDAFYTPITPSPSALWVTLPLVGEKGEVLSHNWAHVGESGQ